MAAIGNRWAAPASQSLSVWLSLFSCQRDSSRVYSPNRTGWLYTNVSWHQIKMNGKKKKEWQRAWFRDSVILTSIIYHPHLISKGQAWLCCLEVYETSFRIYSCIWTIKFSLYICTQQNWPHVFDGDGLSHISWNVTFQWRTFSYRFISNAQVNK